MEFPTYKRDQGALLVFISKTEMYYIHPDGTNKNPGIAIDQYITRKMVLKYQNVGTPISEETFIALYKRLFGTALHKIVNKIV